MLQITPRSLL